MTNMNIQHLESLNDHIFNITGVRVRDTVPDWLVKSATEVVMVDATAEALLNRLKRGVIYAPDKAERALENFFEESTLVSLRELALRQTAHELDVRGTAEISQEQKDTAAASPPKKHIHDRILIFVTDDPKAARLIRRGRRMADYLNAELFRGGSAADRGDHVDERISNVESHLNFARNLHIETRVLEGEDVAKAILDFARRNQITQILLNRPKHRSWSRMLGTDLILRIVRNAKDIRVIVVADRRQQ